ncbi:gliding motility-associated C-terminal domain-containing protein [Croceitalea marina]|uniref:Gliding motility-associated C-terminal domain-containing protein n=1 Tax=Croceitalea marina TaxID=1775166 RepID=A0ABW5N1A4_9FLAO
MKRFILNNWFFSLLSFLLLGTAFSYGQNCSVNAGINETICVNDGTFTLSGSSAGLIQSGPVWSQVAGPSVIIDDPNDPNSSITGLIGGNVYTFRLSANCTDGSTQFQDVNISVEPITIADAGNDVTSCPDTSGAISITGNTPINPGEIGSWSIDGANNAGVTINSPTSATTTLDLAESSAGTTTLRWTITGPDFAPGQFCESSDTITITNYGGELPVSAGANQNLDNCYTVTQSTNLNASFGGNNINGQQGAWSFVSGPSTPNFSNANSNTSNVSNLIEGTYVLRWTVAGPCVSGQDTVTITVDEATQDISNASVQENNIRFCDPSITTTTLVGSQPQFSGETVQWTQTGGPSASILNDTNSTTQISGLVSPNTYTFEYTISNSVTGCFDTETVTIRYSVNPITITANGGTDITGVCGQSEVDIPFTTTGNGGNTFAIVSGPSGSTLVDPNDFNNTGSTPLAIDFDVEGTYTVLLRRAVSGSVQTGCEVGTDAINVTISLNPTSANAGTGQVLACNVTSTSLAGNAVSTGNSLWSQINGPNTATITNPFDQTTPVSGLIPGEYIFQYAISGGNACSPSAESTVSVTVSSDAAITTDAGPNQPLVCFGAPVLLAAQDLPAPNLVGEWTVDTAPVGATIVFADANDPNTLVSGLDDANETYVLRWTVSNPNDNTCPPPGTDTVTITTNATPGPTTANAGTDQCLAAGTGTVNLNGNAPGAGETGQWTATPNTGISFADNTLFNTTATITVDQSYTLTWTISKAGCQSTFDDVEITVDASASANAGPDDSVCVATYTMVATSSTGTGLWTQVSGPGGVTIDDETSPTAQFTFTFSGQYVFEWTVNSGTCSTDSDQITLNIGIPPTIAAVGADQTICLADNTVLSGNGFDSNVETGFWTLLSGAPNTPTIANVNNPNTVVSNLVSGIYNFRWTIAGDSNCPTSFADLQVEVFAPAGDDETLQFCEITNFLVEATFGATGTWAQTSGPTTGVSINQNPANSNVAEIEIVAGSTYEFTFTTDYACGTDTKVVTVVSSTAPSIDPNAGLDQILCTADIGAPFQTTLAGNSPPVDVSNAEWRFANEPSGSLATIDSPNSPTSTISNLSVPGVYILEWNFESGNCTDTADVVRIEVFEAPSTADAGADQTDACQLDAQMNAVPPTAGIGTWTFSNDPSGGVAVIDSPNSPTTTLSNITILGTYELTWTVTNGTTFVNPSLCAPSVDTVEITFTDVPPSDADAGPDQDFCDATSANLAAVALTTGTGTWNQTAGPGITQFGTPATITDVNNPNTPVSDLEAGTYEFTWTASNGGCTLTDTMEIVILSQPIIADAGPDQTIQQFSTIALAATPTTVGTGLWTQISGPTTASFVDDTAPDTEVFGVDVGDYVFEWTVSNGICADVSDTMTLTILGMADLELTKTVNPTSVNAGDTVTFTISIFNNDGTAFGNSDATGVTVEDIVPSGYTLVPGTVSNGGVFNAGDLSIVWSNLTVVFGATLDLSFDATVNTTGVYDNTAEITASDQPDPDSTVNNASPAEDDQSTTAITLQSSDLSLLKTVSPTTASVGETVTFSLEVSNAGTSNASGIAVSDVVPSGYTIGTVNNGGSVSGNEISWSGLSVTSGGSTTVSFEAAVSMPTGAAGEYTNTAEITASDQLDPDSTPGNDDGNQSEDDESASGITLEQVDLELGISSAPTSGNAGDTVTYTVSLTNDDTVATGDATGVDVVVVVPSGFTIVPGSISNGGVYNSGSGTITWSGVSLTNGTTTDFTYDVTVNPSGNYDTTGEITTSDLPDLDSTPNNDDGDQSEDDEALASFTLQSADLSLLKTVSPTTASVGETVTFTLAISNAGTSNATGVSIADLVPGGYTIGTINNGGTRIGNEITWTGLTVTSGGSTSVSFEAVVNMPTGASGEYNNTAEITASDQIDPDSTPNNDNGDQSEDDESASAIVLEVADLELTKSISSSNGNVGDILTFTISLENNGTGDATGVSIVDTLPNGFDIVGGTISNGGFYNPGSLTITWDNLSVTNGATQNLTYDVSVNASGNYTNIAQITASDLLDPDSLPNNDDGDQSEDDETNATFTLQSSDLSLLKTVSPTTASVGETVTFSLEISNAGTSNASGVAVSDVVPSGYTIGTVNNGGSVSGNEISWSGLSVTSGSSTTVSFEAVVNMPTGSGGEYNNTAEITASDQLDPDSTPGNDDGDQSEDDESASSITLEQVDLELDISSVPTSGNAGDTVTYTVALTNDDTIETGDATGVEIVVVVPSGFTIVPGSISGGGVYNPGSGTITWSNVNVANGDTSNFTYDVTVNESGNYNTTGEITASDLPDVDSTPNNDDGDQSEDDEAISPFSLQSADLSLVKDISAGSSATPNIGDTLVFELTITNAGPNTATNVVIEDEVPRGYTLGTVNNGGTSIAGIFLSWDIASLPVGNTTLSYEVTVNEPSGDIDEYLNIAEVAASDQSDPDSEPFNDDGDQDEDDEDFFEITPQLIDLDLDKSVSISNPNVGDVVTFTIAISNLGNAPATGVAVEDILPSGYSNVTSISNGGSFGAGVVSWSGLNIPLGSNSISLTFNAQVLAPTGAVDEYKNRVEVTAADQFDTDSAPNNDDGDQSEDDEDNITIIPQQADLSLTKTASTPSPNVGDTVMFTLTINNLGPNIATNVALEDILPSGFTLTTVNNGGSSAVNTASWTGLTVLANGGSTSVTYEATVNAPTGAFDEYLNVASITASDQFDPDSDPTTGNAIDEDGNGQGDDDDEDAINLTPNVADLSLTKIVVDGDTSPQVGTEISFEITVFNDGPQDANDVVVQDLLPTGFDFILYSSTSGIYNESTGVWLVGDISSGGSETLVIDVLVNPTGNYTNVAEVTASDVFDIDSTPNNDILTEDDQDDVTVSPISTIDISLDKTVSNDTPDVNTDITFTITVTNEGPSEATNLQVLDQLPSGFTYVSDDSVGAYDDTTGNWNIGNLGIGNTTVLNIVATVNTIGVYTNIAEVISHTELDIDSTPNNDILSEDDQDEVVVSPRPLVDISVTKVANDMTPNIGGEVEFTVTVTNDGPSDATNIVVTDLLESGYEFVSATPTNGIYEDLNGSWTIGDLDNGITETIIITANVLANGTYTNTAELTDLNEFDIDSEPSNNDDTEDDQETIEPTPVLVSDLELTKTVNDASPFVGNEVIFTLSLINNGPSDASGVEVVDLLPDGYTYVSNNSTAGVYNEASGLWSLNGVIPNGTTETLNIVVVVNPSGNYSNSAEITGSNNNDIDSTPANDIASEDDQDNADTTPTPLADLSLVKTVDNEFPDVSDTITFTLTLNNAGPSAATGIQVNETLPSGYTYISDDSGGLYNPGTGIWNVTSLAADATIELNIVVGINTTGSYANVAEVIAVNELDPNSTPNNNDINEDDQDEQVTLPRVITDISVLKTVDNANPSVGSQITFTITVTNDGPSDATGLVVEDILASGYEFVNAVPSSGTYDEVIGSWNITGLLNGASETLDIVATVLTNGDYSNTAELIALDTFDPDSSPDNNLNSEDDQDTVTPVPTGLADLSLTKEVDELNPNVGDIIEFTINLTNSGDSDATGVVVTDVVPSGYTYQSHLSTAGVYDPNTGVWNTNGVIPNGTTETLIVLLQVNAPTGTDGEYTNIAEITASNQADPDSNINEDSSIDDLADGLADDDEASVTVVPQSVDISVDKIVSNERPKIGDEIQFTITISNLGISDATNVGIEELLPNGYAYQSSQASMGAFDQVDGFWEIPVLASSETATLIINVEVLEEDDYINTANLAFVDQIDLNESNDSDQATIDPTCLTIYNEFSPNDDGVNDLFQIDCISRYPNNVLRVYNRWGNIVFEQKNYDNTWDGLSNGRATISEQELLPVGTYYYILELGDGSEPVSDWLYINR